MVNPTTTTGVGEVIDDGLVAWRDGIFTVDTTGYAIGDEVPLLLDGQRLSIQGASGGGGGGGGGGGLPDRTLTTVVTAALADGATENATVNLAVAYRLYRVVADRACRVRLYTTPALRDSDAARAPGVDPVYEHGVMADFVFTDAGQLTAAPMIDGYVPTGIAVPYAIENQSGSTAPVRVEFEWVVTEGDGSSGGGSGGTTSELAYTHNQMSPDTDWFITHPLGFVPNVTVVDSAGEVVVGDVEYVSPSQVHLHFSAAFSGVAYLS